MLPYEIHTLHHYGLPFKDEAELAVAQRFYESIGFTSPAFTLVKDKSVVKWYRSADKRELHIFVDNNAPCASEATMIHATFTANDIKRVWEFWQRLGQDGWTDPHTNKTYRLSHAPYWEDGFPGLAKGRVHAFDPWNNHIEFWELEPGYLD